MRCDFCKTNLNNELIWGNYGKGKLRFFRILGLTKFPIYFCSKESCERKALNLAFSKNNNKFLDNLVGIGRRGA